MKIAVAGATGKTGRHLAARLCSDGHRAIALSRDRARCVAVDPRADWRLTDFDARSAVLAMPATLPALANRLGMRPPFDPKEWRRTAGSRRQSVDPSVPDRALRRGILPRASWPSSRAFIAPKSHPNQHPIPPGPTHV
ncbi:MAG: NAD-dependent epimerase/dehydratase family protein [Alphaproteobacteria bacterium]